MIHADTVRRHHQFQSFYQHKKDRNLVFKHNSLSLIESLYQDSVIPIT